MCLDMYFVQCGDDKSCISNTSTFPDLDGQRFFGGMLQYDTDYTSYRKVESFFTSKKTFFGYKFFFENKNNTVHSLYNGNITIGKWVTSRKNLERDLNRGVYVTGFHILWNRAEARKWGKHTSSKLYKVEYKNPHAIGLDSGCQVVLASQMRVIGRAK